MIYLNNMLVSLRGAELSLLDEVERSGARRVQTAMAWPRAAQHQIKNIINQFIKLPTYEL